jgi:hypothetical protein
MNKDNTILGFVIGIISPIIVMLIYWQFNFGHMSLLGFKDLMVESTNLPGLISIGLLGNLAGFFLFYKMELDVSARGVIAATFLYGFVIVILKFLLI